jgi:trans-2-enoyl-CoA reductase
MYSTKNKQSHDKIDTTVVIMDGYDGRIWIKRVTQMIPVIYTLIDGTGGYIVGGMTKDIYDHMHIGRK